jgi:hypothetical protein
MLSNPAVLPHGLSAQDMRLRRLHWETDGEIELPLVSRRSLEAAVSWQEGRMRWVPRSAAVFPRHGGDCRAAWPVPCDKRHQTFRITQAGYYRATLNPQSCDALKMNKSLQTSHTCQCKDMQREGGLLAIGHGAMLRSKTCKKGGQKQLSEASLIYFP